MSGVKHTPWDVEDLGLPEYLDGIRSRFTVQSKSGAPIAYAFDADEARLIAAAPDHHAVALELDRLMLVIDSAVRFADPTFKDEVQALLRANKLAIARARGEQDGGGE